MDKIEELYDLIKQSQKLVFFTGAGASVDSGVSSFTKIYSKNFDNYSPVDIMTKGFQQKHPDIFFKFIKEYFSMKLQPNICHKVIADIGNKMNKDVCVITQNIDGLHQKAGSRPVLEIHGNINKWHCTDCKKTFSFDDILKRNNLNCDEENCNGFIRPNIILYNENFQPTTLKISQNKFDEADTLIVIGTTLNTLFAYEAVKNFKGKIAFINHPLKEPLPKELDLIIYDDVSNVFNQLQELINEDEILLQ